MYVNTGELTQKINNLFDIVSSKFVFDYNSVYHRVPMEMIFYTTGKTCLLLTLNKYNNDNNFHREQFSNADKRIHR